MYESKCENILFSVDERGVAVMTLNRPESLNAFTLEMSAEMADILRWCSEADEVRVVVLAGAGKHFCAGGDIKKFKRNIDAGIPLNTQGIKQLGTVVKLIRTCSKPVVARINGAAVGAGAALAFACDLRVCEAGSKIGAGFLSMGFSGDTNGWYTLSRIIGPARTAQFYMLAETLTAEEAKELGIVTKVAEAGKLDEALAEITDKLANSPTKAIAMQKRMFNATMYKDMDLAVLMEEAYMPACSVTEDHAEAVNAFLEKRAPKFVGK